MKVLALIFIFFLGCATRYQASDEYLDLPSINQVNQESKCSNQTVILFLVDGLSYSTLKSNFELNQLPNIKKFFSNQGSPSKLHSVFPTLTYTNISGILKEKPVHQTESLGNKLIVDGQVIDFESIAIRKKFSKLMRGDNVFSQLAKNNCQTVSLDYGLGVDATIETPLDVQSGLSAQQGDYRYLDKKKIDALSILLKNTDTKIGHDLFLFI